MPSNPVLHIFRPGTHTAVDGRNLAFSESDLAASAAAYNPATHEAPIVVGHPQADLPAYGWISGLRATSDGLEAIPHQVDPAFAEMVRRGAFKKISAKFYEPDQAANPVPGVWYLRHVGFLGAQPPAVKGLRQAAFSDDGSGVELELDVSFAELDPPLQQQESTVTDQELAQLRQRAADADRLQTENQALQTRAETAERGLADHVTTTAAAANTAFCEQLVADRRLIPAEATFAVALLNFAGTGTGDGAEFGEGDAKKPMVEALRGFLSGLPKRVGDGEQASRERAAEGDQVDDGAAFAEGADPARVQQHRDALAYAKKHNVDYRTAAVAVIR